MYLLIQSTRAFELVGGRILYLVRKSLAKDADILMASDPLIQGAVREGVRGGDEV